MRRDRGFTLLELMVSTAILAMLVVLLLGVVDTGTKLWRQSENRVDSYREARAAASMIASDLNSIFVSSNRNFFQWDTAKDKLPAGSVLPTEADHLFFLSAQPASAQGIDKNKNPAKSDLCVVGYFLAFAKAEQNSDKQTMNLYRHFLNSNDTFTDVLQSGNLLPNVLSTAPPTGVEMLARNVTAFHVRAFTLNANGKYVDFSQSVDTPMPDAIEIELTAVNNEIAQRLTNWKTNTSDDFKQNARTFTTRIHLSTDAAKPTPTPIPSPTP